MKSKAVSSVYLDDNELKTVLKIEASNDTWLPGHAKPLDDCFVCYSGYSQDNMLAMSEAMQEAQKQNKKAFIYEFMVESDRNEMYVDAEQAPLVDGIDLARCDKSVLEQITDAAADNGIDIREQVTTMRGKNPMLDKLSLFNALAEQPEILRIASKTVLPKCRYYKLSYSHDGRGYALLYIMDKGAIEMDKNGCVNVTLKLTNRKLLEFPMFGD